MVCGRVSLSTRSTPSSPVSRRRSATPARRLARGSLVAAVVGGFLWGLIVILSEYEIGIAAWGIGFLAGFAVVRFAGGAKGMPLQVVAVVSSLLGIVIGKYISYAYFFKQAVSDRFDVDISYLDSEIFRAFRENLTDVFGGFDLLWAALAVMTAWRLTRPSGLMSRGRLGV